MLRNASWVIALLAVTAIAGWSRGGWAVVTVDSVPEYVEAGKPFTLTWAIRGHGRHVIAMPGTGVTAARSGQEISSPTLSVPERGREISFLTRAGPERGHGISFPTFAGPEADSYSATVTLPSPGDWTLTIWAFQGHRLLPLKVVDAGTRPPAQSLTKRGAHLFVAAGCVSCHAHGDIAKRVLARVGPELTSLSRSEDYLAAVLRDPDSILEYDETAYGWSQWRMPDLGLDEGEIEALVAFLRADSPVRLSFATAPAQHRVGQAENRGAGRLP